MSEYSIQLAEDLFRTTLRSLSQGSENMWQDIETAPTDGTKILLLTSDFGAVEGWWDTKVENYYKSRKGSASYDPDNAHGDWTSHWQVGANPDRRLHCGCTPHFWMPLPQPPSDTTGEA